MIAKIINLVNLINYLPTKFNKLVQYFKLI